MAPSISHAQAAPVVSSRSRAEGQELFRRATRDYDAGHYAAATALFRAAFETDRSSPAYLFNAARAAEMGNEHTQAISLYEWILRELPASDTDAREGAQSALNRLNAARTAEQTQVTDAQRQRELEVQRLRDQNARLIGAPPPPPPSSRFSAGPFVLLGAGALTMGSGGIFYALRQGALSECTQPPMGTTDPLMCTGALEDRAITMNILTNVALAGGGAIVAAGGIWLIVQATSRPRTETAAPRAMLVPTLNGASVVGVF